MNRRAFLKHSWVATLGLAALPIASALRLSAGTARAQDDEIANNLASYNLTEEEVIDLTLNYADSYADALPGVNLRESLLSRLLKDKAGSAPA